MVTSRPLHSIVERLIPYDTGLVVRPKQLGHHIPRKFGVSLRCHKSTGDVHSLGWTMLRMG